MTLRKKDYQSAIFSFAQEAKLFFEKTKQKRIDDEFDKMMYEEFWKEYNQLLQLINPIA